MIIVKIADFLFPLLPFPLQSTNLLGVALGLSRGMGITIWGTSHFLQFDMV